VKLSRLLPNLIFDQNVATMPQIGIAGLEFA
jgi:hypothetical protein